MSRDVDPILLEVFKNGSEAVADEMALILMRTAHSPIVRDAMDFSTALCDAAGQNLAQGLTTPMHLGSFHDAMRHLIGEYAPISPMATCSSAMTPISPRASTCPISM
jgi:N-methylhydantoinase B